MKNEDFIEDAKEDLSVSQNGYNLLEENGTVVCEPQTQWGGPWTEQKLDAFEKYVWAYLTIMNRYRDQFDWKLVYFDGFAGSGSRGAKGQQEDISATISLFQNDVKEEELNVYLGAAERVIRLNRIKGFDVGYFIEKDKKSGKLLEDRLAQYGTSTKIHVLNRDANDALRMLAKLLREHTEIKTLAFLDPFGMQIDWQSIMELKGHPVDLWILIPTGVIINRLLERRYDAESGLHFAKKLTTFFGMKETEIFNYFYSERKQTNLFGEEETIITKTENAIMKIAELYIERLNTVFKYVTAKPMVLYNNHNVPIFHFACASNNPTAIKIAQQIISKQ